ncbi:MAG: hypothetical protein IBJ03_18535 [Gemmatimonadaceae bacterium]|nr:hypothetical protein [Gemmatimonadaceae bacterium]
MSQPSRAPGVLDFNRVQIQSEMLRELQSQRDMISGQYQRAIADRGRVSQERMNAQARGDAAMVREFDGTIERHGKRIQELERTLQQADQRIDEAMKSPVAEIAVPGSPGEPIAIADAPLTTSLSVPVDELISQRIEFQRMMAAEAAGFLLLGALLWRFGFSRGKRAAARQIAPADTAHDERMQQAIDAIAIEVERLSEGQRFTNTLLSSKRNERETLPVTPNRITTPNDGTRITPH